jgi:hypothetical protein
MQRQELHCVARRSAAIGLPGSTGSAAVVSRIQRQKSVITPPAVAHAKSSVFIVLTASNYRKSFFRVEIFSQAACVSSKNTRIA